MLIVETITSYLAIGVLIAWMLGLRERTWFTVVVVLWLPILLTIGFLVLRERARKRRK